MDIRTLGNIFKARVLRANKPVFLSWTITDYCNCSCSFCSLNRGNAGHSDEAVIERAIKEIARNRIIRVNLTGGEPLLHPSFGHILRELKKNGVRVSVNTNGTLVSRMMDVLANVNGVGLSLDGNKETHETIRGSNTFAPVFDAIESLSSAGVPLKLTCVLTKITRLEDVRFVMETAGRYGIAVNFQPATICKSGSRDDNPLAMGKDDYDELFKSITQLKKESPEIIMNSFSGLRHLSRWPGPENIYCGAALIFCNIDPAGNIYGCIDEPGRKAYANILDTGLAEALRNKRITRCGQCWCGERVEANMILTPVLDAVKNYLLVRKSFD